MADLKVENFEINLHYTVNSAKIKNSALLSVCLYTDSDDSQEHPTIKLVLVISNYEKKSNNNNANILILTYKNTRCIIQLNDWDNSKYFIAFFFLFFFLVLEAIYLPQILLKSKRFY